MDAARFIQAVRGLLEQPVFLVVEDASGALPRVNTH
jgi:hypothetical protein